MVEEKESLGRYLKREREFRNLSLGEASKITKVKVPILKAIEEDQYASLPSPTYVKGFLLSYAKYIGLDPDDVLLRYESGLRGRPVMETEPPSEKKISWNIKYLWVAGGAIAVSLLASYFLFLHPSRPPMKSVSEKPVFEKPISEESKSEAPPLPSPPISATASTPEEKPFFLQLKAIERTWVRIQINGQPENEMTLKPGETIAHQGLDRIRLLVGNAGGLDITFDGKSLERFGKSGEVANLTFTSKGVEVKGPEKPKPKPE